MTDRDDREYTLTEFCELTELRSELVKDLVGLGVIEPSVRRDLWYFSVREINRGKTAGRLMHDLEVNQHGVALALDLMDQNRRMRLRLVYLERLINRLYETD